MNKKNIIIVAIVLVAITGGSFLLARDKNAPQGQIGDAQNQPDLNSDNISQVIATPTLEPTPTGATQTNKKTSKSSIPSYTEMVKLYEGRRIQIDNSCQMSPTYSTYKIGTTLMFDNRTPATKKVVIDAKTYNIAGYNYVLVPFKTAKEILVDCDTSQNVITILIQK